MSRFALISVGFHALVVTAMTVSWPAFQKKNIDEEQLVIIDMVDVADITNIAAASQGAPQDDVNQEKARPKPPPPPPPPPPPKPEIQPEIQPAPEPKPVPKPVDASAEILPDKKAPEVAKPIARPVPRPTPPKKPDPKPAPKPKPEPKPKPKPKPKPDLSRVNELAQKSQQDKKRKDAANGVLQNLAQIQKSKEAEEKQAQKIKKDKAKQDAATNLSNVVSKVTQKTDTKPSISPIGVSELDRVRMHIASRWNPPPAAAGADKLKVDIFVRLEQDGSVIDASIVEKKRYDSDQTYRAAANAALRAVLDASPLPLPPEKYDQWREFIFGFDPRFISR